jgi:hypothetical protein
MRTFYFFIWLFAVGQATACPIPNAPELSKYPPFAPKISREYILSQGFKEVEKHQGVFVRKHISVKEVSHILGFYLWSLYYVPNQSRANEYLLANLPGGKLVSLLSEVPLSENRWDGLLNKPDTICTATVSFNPTREKRYLSPFGTPRLRITSITMPKDRNDPLQIEFELSVDDKGPIALSKDQFAVHLSVDGKPVGSFPLSLAETKEEIIKVMPGKPVSLKGSIPSRENTTDKFKHTHWNKLPLGKHDLRVGIGFFNKTQTFDYQWRGTTWSEKQQITIQ